MLMNLQGWQHRLQSSTVHMCIFPGGSCPGNSEWGQDIIYDPCTKVILMLHSGPCAGRHEDLQCALWGAQSFLDLYSCAGSGIPGCNCCGPGLTGSTASSSSSVQARCICTWQSSNTGLVTPLYSCKHFSHSFMIMLSSSFLRSFLQ